LSTCVTYTLSLHDALPISGCPAVYGASPVRTRQLVDRLDCLDCALVGLATSCKTSPGPCALSRSGRGARQLRQSTRQLILQFFRFREQGNRPASFIPMSGFTLPGPAKGSSFVTPFRRCI